MPLFTVSEFKVKCGFSVKTHHKTPVESVKNDLVNLSEDLVWGFEPFEIN